MTRSRWLNGDETRDPRRQVGRARRWRESSRARRSMSPKSCQRQRRSCPAPTQSGRSPSLSSMTAWPGRLGSCKKQNAEIVTFTAHSAAASQLFKLATQAEQVHDDDRKRDPPGPKTKRKRWLPRSRATSMRLRNTRTSCPARTHASQKCKHTSTSDLDDSVTKVMEMLTLAAVRLNKLPRAMRHDAAPKEELVSEGHETTTTAPTSKADPLTSQHVRSYEEKRTFDRQPWKWKRNLTEVTSHDETCSAPQKKTAQ